MADGDLRDKLAERAERAAVAPRHLLEAFYKETAKEVLVALARHPRTPRLISLPILKFLYLFDLLRVAQTPAVPADVKLVAEEIILNEIDTLPRGKKISLARRGSGRVAAGLLVSEDRELILAALDNPFLTEAHMLKILALENLPVLVVELIAHHPKWCHRYHLRLALIRNPRTPFQQVLAFIPDMAVNDLRDICLDRRMTEHVRRYVLAHCARRLGKGEELS